MPPGGWRSCENLQPAPRWHTPFWKSLHTPRPPAGAVAVALFGRQGFFLPESLVELAAAEAGAAYPSSFGQATQMIPEMPGVMSDGMEELGDKPTLYTTSGESNRRVHGQKRAFAVASEMWSDA